MKENRVTWITAYLSWFITKSSYSCVQVNSRLYQTFLQMSLRDKFIHLDYTESGIVMRLYGAYDNSTPLTKTNGFVLLMSNA